MNEIAAGRKRPTGQKNGNSSDSMCFEFIQIDRFVARDLNVSDKKKRRAKNNSVTADLEKVLSYPNVEDNSNLAKARE
jgi:hypothetical protein